jgi:hypothetical protein
MPLMNLQELMYTQVRRPIYHFEDIYSLNLVVDLCKILNRIETLLTSIIIPAFTSPQNSILIKTKS